MRTGLLVMVAAALVVGACGAEAGDRPSTTDASSPPASTSDPETVETEGCAHVVDAELTVEGGGVYRVEATVSSADTGWDKYADAWEVREPDGEVLGTRELAHPHVDEQPFTRSLGGVEIPPEVDVVVIAARDSVEGFCGETVAVEVPEG